MYMDYGRLWKLLIDRGLSKGDLAALTGISSRVMAKLSKNETVTTETLVRICAALKCEVGDIMECVGDDELTVYGAFRKFAKCIDENELYAAYSFTYSDRSYVVYRSKRTATKGTHIECRKDGSVYWVQLHGNGHVGVLYETNVLIKPIRDKDTTVIVLIKGRPAVICGLDENGFVSSRGTRRSDTDVYVMSEAAFKLFAPKDL